VSLTLSEIEKLLIADNVKYRYDYYEDCRIIIDAFGNIYA